VDCFKFADVCFGGDWTPYCASIFKVWSSDRLVGRDQDLVGEGCAALSDRIGPISDVHSVQKWKPVDF
jgi:hypothetical protein